MKTILDERPQSTNIEKKYPILKRICDFFGFPLYSFEALSKGGTMIQGQFRSFTVKQDEVLKQYVRNKLKKHNIHVETVYIRKAY